MGSGGRVPHGAVGPQLLRRDASAPYGERFDDAAVEAAVRAAWKPRSVTLVEASDLVRADRDSAFATADGKAQLRRTAIRGSDRLFGELLQHVDLAHDAVLVVAPVPPNGDRSVTVTGLRGPGIDAGLLRSATTRRSGFVTLADVAPTVLSLLDLPVPTSMEGRPMRVDEGHGSATDRIAMLDRANADGLLRDDLVNPVTAATLWTAMALVVACLLVFVVSPSLLKRYPWIPTLLQWVALALVGFILATLPATLFHFGEHGGKVGYWLFVSLFAIAIAAVCRLAGGRRHLDAFIWAVSALLAVIVVDQLTGGHLEFNSVFGYSATVGIRFSGIGNQSSALLATAAVLVAAFASWRIAPPRGTRLAVVLLVVSFVAITPPLFGQDFGGTLAAAPAFALLGWLLLGRRVTAKAVLALLGTLIVSGLSVGFLDLLRPSDQRTHVGRFFEKVGNEGLAGFSTVIERKSGENAATLSSGIYLAVIVVVLAAGVLLWTRPPRPLAAAVSRVPTLGPAAISFAVLLVLSYGLNDSGLAIPAIMLALVAAAGTYVMATSPEREKPARVPPGVGPPVILAASGPST
jgi:MFS family permease